PAHHPNPLQLINSVAYHDAGGNLGNTDEEGADESQASDAQMASSNAAPDVEPEADTEGQVKKARLPRAMPVAAPAPVRRNFFERLFGVRRAPTQATPPPVRRPSTR